MYDNKNKRLEKKDSDLKILHILEMLKKQDNSLKHLKKFSLNLHLKENNSNKIFEKQTIF